MMKLLQSTKFLVSNSDRYGLNPRLLSRSCLANKISKLKPLINKLDWLNDTDSLFRAYWSYFASGCKKRQLDIRRRIEQHADFVQQIKDKKAASFLNLLTHNRQPSSPETTESNLSAESAANDIYKEFVDCFRRRWSSSKVKHRKHDRSRRSQFSARKREVDDALKRLQNTNNPYDIEQITQKLNRLNQLQSQHQSQSIPQRLIRTKIYEDSSNNSAKVAKQQELVEDTNIRPKPKGEKSSDNFAGNHPRKLRKLLGKTKKKAKTRQKEYDKVEQDSNYTMASIDMLRKSQLKDELPKRFSKQRKQKEFVDTKPEIIAELFRKHNQNKEYVEDEQDSDNTIPSIDMLPKPQVELPPRFPKHLKAKLFRKRENEQVQKKDKQPKASTRKREREKGRRENENAYGNTIEEQFNMFTSKITKRIKSIPGKKDRHSLKSTLSLSSKEPTKIESLRQLPSKTKHHSLNRISSLISEKISIHSFGSLEEESLIPEEKINNYRLCKTGTNISRIGKRKEHINNFKLYSFYRNVKYNNPYKLRKTNVSLLKKVEKSDAKIEDKIEQGSSHRSVKARKSVDEQEESNPPYTDLLTELMKYKNIMQSLKTNGELAQEGKPQTEVKKPKPKRKSPRKISEEAPVELPKPEPKTNCTMCDQLRRRPPTRKHSYMQQMQRQLKNLELRFYYNQMMQRNCQLEKQRQEREHHAKDYLLCPL
ncbi:uncharacterized protein LOC6560301 isoform X1 [Drosophila grimshawi]|uniref:uncharacterized protein LOC6560301 isoform X1 n=1 Tax=Drosophila grimshawi TaxID=7222 RepID=UPI000C86FCD9|nr:uncharacterized protein LOC6560301 isoform X1 [Drosophila grimshawi]